MALDNETSGEDARCCSATVLELAETLAIEMGTGSELLEGETKRGIWAEPTEAEEQAA